MGSVVVAIVAVAAFAQTWDRASGSESTLVAQQKAAIQEHEILIGQAFAISEQGPGVAEQVAQAIAAHSQAFPLQPTVVTAHETTVEEAVAQHGALIDGWLSAGV
jgi:hypothetical protein